MTDNQTSFTHIEVFAIQKILINMETIYSIDVYLKETAEILFLYLILRTF